MFQEQAEEVAREELIRNHFSTRIAELNSQVCSLLLCVCVYHDLSFTSFKKQTARLPSSILRYANLTCLSSFEYLQFAVCSTTQAVSSSQHG